MEQTDKLPVSIPTVGELLHDYLNLAKRNLALSTFNCYDANTKLHLLPRWESTPVTEVTVRELRSWIKAFTCKRKTLQLILTPFRNTFEQALDDQLIDANPFDVIRLNKILARTQLKSEFKAAPFDIDEIEAILDACDRPQERNMFQLAFSTGMRPSEYIALTWRAVSFREMRVSVEAAFVDGEAKDTAKTDAGLRQIDLRNGALTALQAQTSFTGNGQELVFHNPTYGAQWEGDKPIHRRWRRILKQASVHYRNPYQTRHTFASSLLMLGELPLYVASQMGHTDTTMITTMITRTYGKWIRSGLDDGKRERLLKMYARTGQ
ncbi:tyrosine-type recombinase/integrase [Massilia aquatica]|nr:tyrosine-type recombinase/integrase [Massilia aquatica]